MVSTALKFRTGIIFFLVAEVSDNDETSSTSDEEVVSRKRSVDPLNESDKETEHKKPKKRVTDTDQHVNLLHRLFPYQTVDVSSQVYLSSNVYNRLGSTAGAGRMQR